MADFDWAKRLLALVFVVSHCGGAQGPNAPAVSQAAPPPAPPSTSVAPTPAGSAAPTSSVGPEANSPFAPCTALGCRRLASPDVAFREVLSEDMLVLAVGEGHAQKGTEGIPSATRHFTESVLPLLEGRASDIVIELWMPDPKCEKKVAQVKERQKPITSSQAKTNKNEFAILAEEASKRGIVPWPLRPTCAEYDAIVKAGDDAVPLMLELTAKMASRTIQRCLQRNAAAGVQKLVVSYGGAMHNDLAPAPGRGPWTFGPELAALTHGRYVELDLFVPESILDTETWRHLAWHPYFDRSRPAAEATFFHPSAQSWVLIFPTYGSSR